MENKKRVSQQRCMLHFIRGSELRARPLLLILFLLNLLQSLCIIRMASSDIHVGIIYKLCIYFHSYFTRLRISNYQKRAFPKVVDIVKDFLEILAKETSNADILWLSKNKSSSWKKWAEEIAANLMSLEMWNSLSMKHCRIFCRLRFLIQMMFTVGAESTSFILSIKEDSIAPSYLVERSKWARYLFGLYNISNYKANTWHSIRPIGLRYFKHPPL